MKILKISLVVLIIGALGLGMFFACPNDGKRVMEKDTYFTFDTLGSSVKGIPVVFLNKTKSSIILRKDGTATIRLVFLDVVGSLLSDIEIGDVDEFANILDMLYEYLPGLDLTDLNAVIKVFKGGLGITLLGVEPDDQEFQAMFTYMAETKGVPTNIYIPKGFGLEINNKYYIKDVTSPVTEVTYTGVFMGDPHPDGESFLILDLEQDESGKQKIIMNYPLIDLYLVAYETNK